MPKRLLVESRSNWRGGLNTTQNQDELQADELIETFNTRLTDRLGSLTKRSGTRRLHASAVAGSNVLGVFQWDAPAGKELVAVDANGDLLHKTSEFGAFTVEAASISAPVVFVPFRSTSAGAALVLYIAGGNGNTYSWNGTTLTQIDGTNSVPNSTLLEAYHTRMFARDLDLKKNIFWSVIGDAADFTIGASSQGGSAVVDILTGEEIIALQTVGSSLAIGTEDSLVRFTGYSSNDIRVDQDTEGISGLHGPVGTLAMRRAEEFVAMLTDRGAYLFDEGRVLPIGEKVEADFDALTRTSLGSVVLQYHRGRREIWFAVPRAGDSGNQSVFVYSVRLQAWYGPFVYPFAINDLARYEDPNGDEFLVAACNDGFVRHMDTGFLDDVLSDGTGGTVYRMRARLAPLFFETGPWTLKALKEIALQADIAADSSLVVTHQVDQEGYTSEVLLSSVSGLRPYRVDLSNQGHRLTVGFETDSPAQVTINGFQVFAHEMDRP